MHSAIVHYVTVHYFIKSYYFPLAANLLHKRKFLTNQCKERKRCVPRCMLHCPFKWQYDLMESHILGSSCSSTALSNCAICAHSAKDILCFVQSTVCKIFKCANVQSFPMCNIFKCAKFATLQCGVS